MKPRPLAPSASSPSTPIPRYQSGIIQNTGTIQAMVSFWSPGSAWTYAFLKHYLQLNNGSKRKRLQRREKQTVPEFMKSSEQVRRLRPTPWGVRISDFSMPLMATDEVTQDADWSTGSPTGWSSLMLHSILDTYCRKLHVLERFLNLSKDIRNCVCTWAFISVTEEKSPSRRTQSKPISHVLWEKKRSLTTKLYYTSRKSRGLWEN